MTIMVTKGALDWDYPPFILAAAAAAMDVDVTMFSTFYGRPPLLKGNDLQVSALGDRAMRMPTMGGHMATPPPVAAPPGADALTSRKMKTLIAR